MTSPLTRPGLEPGQDIFEALLHLAPGQWKIRGKLSVFEMSSKLERRAGWVHVARNAKDGTTELMWTTGKDTHQPLDGRAHSLTIAANGQLTLYANSALSMHMKWGRGLRNYQVDDEAYRDALDVATSLHTALIVDRRGTHIPERTQINTEAAVPAPDTTSVRLPKWP